MLKLHSQGVNQSTYTPSTSVSLFLNDIGYTYICMERFSTENGLQNEK